jgi:hypothetical protein
MHARPEKAGEDGVVRRHLLLDAPVRIRKGPSHADQRLCEPVQPWALPRQRHLLHHIAEEVVAGGVDLARGEDLVDKRSDTGLWSSDITSPMVRYGFGALTPEYCGDLSSYVDVKPCSGHLTSIPCRVEPVVSRPAPPQIRTCAINASGSSVTRVSAPL